jgi:hypothetical protein
MSELPKIVRARLDSQAADGHPDSDVLTAFYEQVLPENERGPVLAHLAQCADCREVVALALPAMEETSVRAARQPASLWGWPLVRWGSLVACLVVVGAAVLIHPKPGPVAVRPSSEDEVVWPEKTTAKALSEPDAAEPNALVVTPPAQSATPPARKEKEREQLNAGAQQNGGSQAAQLGKQLASAPTAGAGLSAPADQNAFRMSRESQTVRPTTAPAPAGSVGGVVNGLPGASGGAPAPTLFAKAMKANAAKAETRSPDSTEFKSADVPGRAKGGTVTGATEVSVTAESDAVSDASAPAQWILSREGQLQRSFDAGKTWEPVPVVERAKFTALSALGPDVWAGGAAGVLYHSADNGTHWTLVKPSVEGVVLAADITGLHFTDPQHGALTTADGHEWSTADGGRSWQTKP